MGMFDRLNKENERRQKLQQKLPEFQEALRVQMDFFTAMTDPSHVSHEQTKDFKKRADLLRISRERRDECSALNLVDHAALFATIHWRTFGLILFTYRETHEDLPEGFTEYGTSELTQLGGDVRNIRFAVSTVGVDAKELEECTDFYNYYKEQVIEAAKVAAKADNLVPMGPSAFSREPKPIAEWLRTVNIDYLR